MTIAEAAARCGLPESTLRYWERIGLVNRVRRDASSGHRRYRPEDVATLETLGNLRAVGLSIEDMRAYLASARRGDEAAGEQRELFETHARRLADEVAELELRRRYLDLKVRSRYYPSAELDALRSSGRYTFKTPAQGAATSVYVATSPRLGGVAGRYFENCQEATPDDPTAAGTDAAGVAAYALDPESAQRLWAVSEQMNQ